MATRVGVCRGPRYTDRFRRKGLQRFASVSIGPSGRSRATATVSRGPFDHLFRERLARYINRPAFSLSRLSLCKDGTVVYLVKKVGRRRARCRIMTPLE